MNEPRFRAGGGRIVSVGECMIELRQAEAGFWQKGYAGDTFNTAYYARLFLPNTWDVEYVTAVGSCAVSSQMLEYMESVGIGIRFVRRLEGGTPGLYMIQLDAGERSFAYWRSASAARRLADDPAHLRAALAASDVIIFSGITLAILDEDAAGNLLLALAEAKAGGRWIVFDPNIRPTLWADAGRMRDMIALGARVANLVMPSFEDERRHFGDPSVCETVKRYRSLGADGVVVKDGAQGVTLALADGTAAFVPARPVSQIVDTTSAGDSFNGAFLARFLETGDGVIAAAHGAEIAARVIGCHGALVGRDRLLAA